MVVYAEPCLKQTSYAPNRTTMLAAGYNLTDDLRTFYDGLDSLTAFTQTRVGVAYNDYQYIDSNGQHAQDRAIRDQIMDYHRQKFGERAVLQNNSLRFSLFGSELYTKIQSMGPPFSFQTGTMGQLAHGTTSGHDGLIEALDFAVNLGAHAVEVPNNENLTSQEKIDYDALLRLNP
jgi:hypothetical protein